jgi:cyclic pyranopterin phosphate synthase
MFTKKPICNAPFANLYIDGNGNVTPCCFNRDDVFGNIYHHSIEEIWNSVNAIKLRKSLSKKEFPEGCTICKKAIESNNYYNSGIFTYSKLKYKKQQIQAIDFELSYLCNLSCIMCNLHSKDYSLSEEQENIILNKIKPLISQLKKVRFYGGEPLLIPIYRKIWKLIVESNPKCNILLQTNGMLLDEELISLTKKGNFTFNISLDSLNPDTASNIRRGSQLDLILINIKQIKKITRNDISLAVTPMILNWKEIPAIVNFANKNSLQLFFNDMVQPQKLSLWTLKSEELNEINIYLSKYKFYPYNFIRFFNLKKYIGFIHHIKHLELQALNRPNYEKEELFHHTQTIYNIINEKLPTISKIDKNILFSKIQTILFTKRVEEIEYFLMTNPAEVIENKIHEFLNKE